MYAIILSIHAIFIFLTHLLGYQIFEGIFIILCIFFLFYFSPLFFVDTPSKKNSWIQNFALQDLFQKISPKDSLFIPLTLLYLAIYGFIISSFWNTDSFLIIHSVLSLGIFLILFGFLLSFEWKNDMFFEIFIYHSIISLVSGIVFSILSFFGYIEISFLFILLGSIAVGSWVFLISFSKKINNIYIILFLSAVISTFYLLFQYIFASHGYIFPITLILSLGILFFEYFPKLHPLSRYTNTIRYFSLILLFLTIPFLLFFLFVNITSPFLLLVVVLLFLFSIHIRFSNYITYITGIILIYFLYSVFFITLLSAGSVTSVLLFIFFLPFLLMALTYFWEERYEYDFVILHYSAIFFSALYSIYALFFLWWWGGFLFMLSSCIFGLAILFFLSYFRFKK